MNKTEKKSLRKSFKKEENQIRYILNEWDPIPGSPEDEYDCLVHIILSSLHKGSNQKAIEDTIIKELMNHFGIKEESNKICNVSSKIWQWWLMHTAT